MLDQPEFPKNNSKVLNGWALFDWANSAFALVITVAIFPGYYEAMTDDTISFFNGSFEMSNTSLFAFAVSTSYLLIAIFSPWLSGMADYGGKKMFFLKLFSTIGAVACMLLYFFQGMETLWLGTWAFIFGMIGFAGGLVFYNSYLPEIATEDRYDEISARGFAYGFIGSVLLLIVNLYMLQSPATFGLPEESSLPARISFIMVGLWWIGWAQIPFRRLPPDPVAKGPIKNLGKKGREELIKVWNELKNQGNTKRFLISFFCYSAGVQTVLYMASIFGSEELGFEVFELIILVLILQIVAIGGAYLFAYVSGKKGNIYSLLVQLVIWTIICAAAYFVDAKWQFYSIAAGVGIVMGGTQSLSRATYSKLIPENTTDTTSYFSFYDVCEKVAIVLGTFLFGLFDAITGSMRASVLILTVFFIASMLILRRVKIN